MNQGEHMRISEGPLTQRQEMVAHYSLQGNRHKEIAKKMGITLVVVRQEVHHITNKMGASTQVEAMALYATARAYRNAAALLMDWVIPDDGDSEANGALNDLAQKFLKWHDVLMSGRFGEWEDASYEEPR